MTSTSFLAVVLLGGSFLCCGPSEAQALRSGDVSEWSGFGTPAMEPVRTGPQTDWVFQDVQHEGPWSRSAERQLGQAEQGLFALLAAQRWPEALAHLKQTQPDLNRRDELGATPLSLVARAGQLALLKEMLRQGADVDSAGAAGMTPLGAAAFAGHDLVVRELLRQQARVDLPMANGQYPLHWACATGQVNTMTQLLKAGADWRLPNRQGRHAVEEAAYFGQLQALVTLQEHGADVAAPDAYRLNAVHAAALGEQVQTLAWLRAQGVRVPSVFSQLLIDQLDGPRAPKP